jgi:hypothetical protein
MHGYPLDKSGTGKVKILTDADGDGHMDHSTVFAAGLEKQINSQQLEDWLAFLKRASND